MYYVVVPPGIRRLNHTSAHRSSYLIAQSCFKIIYGVCISANKVYHMPRVRAEGYESFNHVRRSSFMPCLSLYILALM